MRPDNFFLGGGAKETQLVPAVLVLVLVATVCILTLPRKYVIVPVLLAAFMVPRGQVLVLAGFHLDGVRMIALCGWLRLAYIKLIKRESLFAGRMNPIDNALVLNSLIQSLAVVMLFMVPAAVTNQLGALWSFFGMYFLLRALIRDKEDVFRAIKVFAVILSVVAFGMTWEVMKNQNLFGVYMGASNLVPMIRDGRVRAAGVFGHPVLAGTCAAFLMPLFLMLWTAAKVKWLATIGLVASAVMAYTSASSTSIMAFVAAVIALGFWPIRKQMRLVRWAIVVSLIFLHLFMKAPVWFLIARMDVIGASSGYHRAALVDMFIRHFFDWWLIGTQDAAKWGWDMFDISNAYIAAGETGGLFGFIFFLAVIVRSFRALGKARKTVEGNRREEWLIWLLCSCMFANVVGYFGISYWDVTQVAWYSLLAIISVWTTSASPQLPIKQETELEEKADFAGFEEKPQEVPVWGMPAPARWLDSASADKWLRSHSV